MLVVAPTGPRMGGGMAMTTIPGDKQPGSPQPGATGAPLSQRQPRQLVVTLPGEIDITSDGQVQDALTRALDDGTVVLIADASMTTYCACAGVHALLLAHHRAAAAGAQLRVAASPAVRRILELTGTDHVLDTYPTLAAALAGKGDRMTELGTTAYELSGLHHVLLAIPPGGEDLARRYYGEILGMAELEKPPALAAKGGCWFRRGGLEVHLGVEKEFRAAAKAHPGVLVQDLDALAVRLKAAGADVEWDNGLPGYRRFYSRDLHGNRLELMEPAGA